jgi:HlyD family secretion protein
MTGKRQTARGSSGVAVGLAMALTAGLVLVGCGAREPEALHGYIEAELLHVAPVTTGTLARVAVARGQRVEVGQPLFAMDSTPELHSVAAASARQDRAAAQLANLRTGKRPLEITSLEQQVLQAEAALAGSTSALHRQAQLVDQGFVSAARLDELRATRDRDAARVRELQAQMALARQASRRDEIEAADADTRAAKADTALAGWRQGQTQRNAPQPGQVFDVVHRPGEVVTAGSPVVSLLPDGALKVLFFVPERQLPLAAVGRTVRFACDGCAPDQRARIRWVSPQAEYTPPVLYGNEARAKLVFRVEAEPLPGIDLRPGQPVDVRFDAGRAP